MTKSLSKNSILYLSCAILFLILFTDIYSCGTTGGGVMKERPSVPSDYLEDKTYRLGFYNVENLFDLEDNPKKGDEAFTPTGKQKWNEERYRKKLNDLSKVIRAMGSPTLLGLCEVENKKVLEDLKNTTYLKSYNYGIVHEESPDFRGIDVAFLYQKEYFKLVNSEIIRINFPKEIVENYTTRDVLYVEGKLKGKNIHIFINHWPSRRGGLKESQPKRVYVAEQVKKKVDQILKADDDANILLTGDFNDEPTNKSIAEVLGAKAPIVNEAQEEHLYNLMLPSDKEGEGTYNYRGNWNMLDQIIVSESLLEGEEGIKAQNPQIFKRGWMIYKHDRFGETPNRTYGGPNYYGGFSDHFPVLVELRL